MLKHIGLRLLTNYIKLVERLRFPIVMLFIVVSITAGFYTVNYLGMNTDTREMLSPELPWRQLDLNYEKHFPQFLDTILVVTEATTPDQASDAATLLNQKFLEQSELFNSIYYPRAVSTFRDDALLFLSTAELYELSDNLAKIQPFLTRLTDDMSIRGLFNMLSDAIHAIEDGEDFDIVPLLRELNMGVLSALNDSPYRVSWQNLIDSEVGTDSTVYRDFIILQPVLDSSAMLPANRVINIIHEMVESDEVISIGAKVRLTGSEVLAQEELLSVSRGTELAIILSLCLVTIIMITGIRSLRLVSYTLITLVTGLLLTAAFATFAIGELNLISVAFAVLYIGLGIDFAIHYTLRYRELINQGNANHLAIEETSRNLGQSLIICTITTAVGFFAFVPTDYQGVAELGLISGVGMFISLFVTLTLLPAILSLCPLTSQPNSILMQTDNPVLSISRLPIIHSNKIKTIALISVIAASITFMGIRFDHNILNLQDPDNESVQTYIDLLKSSDHSPWNGVIVTDNRADAINTRQKIESSPVVDSVIWLEDFIPADQDEKLFIIDEINLLLAGGFSSTQLNQTLTTNNKLAVLNDFIITHNQSPLIQDNPELETFMANLQQYFSQLQSMSSQQQEIHLNDFSTTMLASLPGRLDMLNASLNADYVSLDTLPAALTARWLSPNGNYLLHITPAEDLNENATMRRFVEGLYHLDSRLTGPPVINIEAGDAVISAFKQALTYAVIAIAIILLLLLPNKTDSILAMSALVFAVIVTGGISVVLDISLNFANIIALPLLLGIGVDSAIHILHRFRTALPKDNNVLATSSARAVIVSTFTTMGSIGNLAFSPHAGTASMGKLLTIGIGMTLVATLIVLPGLLAGRKK